jgi:hypothetical protein
MGAGDADVGRNEIGEERMRAWGNGLFESDAALDEVYRVLYQLWDKVEELACKPFRRGDCLLYDSERLDGYVAMLLVLARSVYRPATFTWIVRGDLLPDAETIACWKAKFLERWDKHAERTLMGTPKFLRKLGRTLARKLDRLAALSRRQQEQLQSTLQEYMEEIMAAQKKREAAEAKRSEK